MVRTEAYDREIAVDRQRLDENIQGFNGKLHSVIYSHASTAIDDEDKVEVTAGAKHNLLWLLIFLQ